MIPVHPRAGRTHLVVLPVQQEVQRDEVIIVGGRTHVEHEAMDAILHEGPDEHPEHEEEREQVLMDRDVEL